MIASATPISAPLGLARQSERFPVSAEVGMRRQSRRCCRVGIYDLSRHGCRTEFIERPQIHEYVWVKLDGLEPLGAYVCWVDGFQAGLEFDCPIHPAVFNLLLSRLPPVVVKGAQGEERRR